MTPRCAAAAVVSAVVLRRPTKEYTHRYSMMHRRLTTAGIEVAPHYHQLLVLGMCRLSVKSRTIVTSLLLIYTWYYSKLQRCQLSDYSGFFMCRKACLVKHTWHFLRVKSKADN